MRNIIIFENSLRVDVKFRYSYIWGGSHGQVARSLLISGIPTIPFYGFTPHELVLQLWLRQAAIYASPIIINR